MKFPRRALFLLAAFFFIPAWSEGVITSPLVDEEEVQLAFDMCWNSTPSLLITVDCLKGHSQKSRKLFLGFSKFFSGFSEFVLVHVIVLAMLLNEVPARWNRKCKFE